MEREIFVVEEKEAIRIEKIVTESKALHTNVILKVIIPKKSQPEKVLILLHGKIQSEGEFSLIENLPTELDLEELCNKYNLLVVIPYMKNCYYISTEDYNCDVFIAKELPELIYKKYSISERSEVIQGGISMGGYGASLIGAHTGAFKKIISISGAYIISDIVIGNPEVWGDIKPIRESTKGSYLYYFLPLDELEESREKNAFAALSLFSENNADPVFVVTCGTNDWLYSRNLTFVNKLEEQGITYSFHSISDGEHDSVCFKEGLWKAMQKLDTYSAVGK